MPVKQSHRAWRDTEVAAQATDGDEHVLPMGSHESHLEWEGVAYASGCDVVILGSDFERLQIIPGAKHGNIQVCCVDCSLQGGQIAASYGSIVCVFEPVQHPDQKDTSLTIFEMEQNI
ncbi:DmX-like protein 1 [Liparis tanakae]|uniref:DmX-like protein 1 n=1 Tax=Liparis tanakae TaxID=230148 RepID=A0A4Z2H232_9TELE|nr:DmX-like protein 1 [Liparis tanakae]